MVAIRQLQQLKEDSTISIRSIVIFSRCVEKKDWDMSL
jgi:hypothetical protein